MKIIHITTQSLRIPLKKPFITNQRAVYALENLLIGIIADTGETGFGEAPVATAVTGETGQSITAFINDCIAPLLIHQNVEDIYPLTRQMHASLPGNPSAKAAAEAALFDLRAKQLQIPLHRLLSGGYDLHGNGITISAGSGDIMAADCLQYLSEGDYTHHLKIKMGKQPSADADTLITIWHTIREQKPAVTFDFRVDANGGWLPKTAVNIIRTWEREGLPVVWVEQPTPRWDIDGLQSVTQRTDTPIMADESVFTAKDAICVLEKKAADWINIKLAKAGGITRVQEIAALCNAYGVPWMMGCMLESRLAVSAAAACASAWGAGAIDLDGPLLCAKDPFTGGPIFEGPNILFQKTPITPLDSYFGVKP